MKINKFLLLVNLSVIIVISLFFMDFFYTQKRNLENLIVNNIKLQLIETKYIFSKALNLNDNFLLLKPFLDRKVVSNNLIKGFVVKYNNKILKSGDVNLQIPLKSEIKYDIKNLTFNDIKNKKSFYSSIYYYKNGKLKHADLFLFVNKFYIKEKFLLLKINYLIFYLLLVFVILIFTYLVFNYYISKPLEKLKLYAEEKISKPNKFFIIELEEIKESLSNTFTTLQQTIKELYKSSITDSLTKVANRKKLQKYLTELINLKNIEFAVIYIDLDNFKEINDYYGHSTGDEVIIKFAKILKQDTFSDELVVRMGGDEFVLVWKEYNNKNDLINRIENLFKSISQHLYIEGVDIEFTISAGIAIYPNDGENEEELIKNSDIALREAKKVKNRYVFFDKKLLDFIKKEINIKKEFPKALKNNEFELFYQPKVDKNQKVVSCEALIRWVKPDGKIILPKEFIGIAEKSGFINELGKWIIEEVFKTINEWKDDAKLKNISIAFNISPIQIKNESFLKSFIFFIIDKYKPNAKNIEVEITETALIENEKEAKKILINFHNLGTKINLDDFGTGYSSIAFLKKFDVDIIKIDKTFVDDVLEEKSRNYVKAIVDMAKTLDKELVAEGVETKEQFEVLKDLGVDYFQGYYFAKPLNKKDFKNYVYKNLNSS